MPTLDRMLPLFLSQVLHDMLGLAGSLEIAAGLPGPGWRSAMTALSGATGLGVVVSADEPNCDRLAGALSAVAPGRDPWTSDEVIRELANIIAGQIATWYELDEDLDGPRLVDTGELLRHAERHQWHAHRISLASIEVCVIIRGGSFNAS